MLCLKGVNRANNNAFFNSVWCNFLKSIMGNVVFTRNPTVKQDYFKNKPK